MRLFFINCLLLASIVTALPNGRHKRDFPTIRNWIRTALFGGQQYDIQPSPILKTENEYQIYRLPGFDDIKIKVAPETLIAKEFVYPELNPVNINAFGSVVGTKSNKDTLVAVKKVNNLLRTKILNGKHNTVLQKNVVPLFPTINIANKKVAEKITPSKVIEKRPPVVKKVIKPYEEKIEVEVPFEPKYSYKQIQNNEPVLTYTAHTNPDVKVMAELPMCIKERVDEAIVLGANPYKLVSAQEVSRSSPLHISYPAVEILPERFETVACCSPKQVQDSPTRLNIRPMKTQAIDPHPVPLYSHSSPHSNVVEISPPKASSSSSTTKSVAFTNLGNQVEITRTLGPIPPQYLPSENGLPKRTKVNEKNVATILATKDNISNGMISSSIYKKQNDPNTGKIMQAGGVPKTDVDMRIENNYSTAPSATNKETSNVQISKEKDTAYTNKITVKSQTVPPVIISSTNAPKENSFKAPERVFSKGNPTVVPDVKTYSYEKKNPDGSSLSIVGNKNGVVIDVQESVNKGRGDIPEEQRK